MPGGLTEWVGVHRFCPTRPIIDKGVINGGWSVRGGGLGREKQEGKKISNGILVHKVSVVINCCCFSRRTFGGGGRSYDRGMFKKCVLVGSSR